MTTSPLVFPRLAKPTSVLEAAYHKTPDPRRVPPRGDRGLILEKSRAQKGANLGEEPAATKAENRQLQERTGR
jgi:hypothetical protein